MGVRTVITGMGVISPVGNTVQEVWDNLKNGRSGLGLLTHCNPDLFDTKVMGEVRNFEPKDYFEGKRARKMGRFTQFFCAAGVDAVRDAKLDNQNFYPSDRIAVIVGNGVGGFLEMEQNARLLESEGPQKVDPIVIPRMIINEASCNLAMLYGFNGPNLGVVTACSSSSDAVSQAFLQLQLGLVDVVVVGGAEASVTELSITAFAKLKAMSTGFSDAPEKASRPFDKRRDGFVMSEGSAVLVLETYENAKKRNAKIYGEILSTASTCDAYHLTAPREDGLYTSKAIRSAVERAGIPLEQIKYINAHGTSTQLNDLTETKAIRLAFGAHADRLKVSSTKSMTGHMLGAAGAIELIAIVKALENQFVPPTINQEEPDPACDLDYVPNRGEALSFDTALSISMGFGGHNTCIVVKSAPDQEGAS